MVVPSNISLQEQELSKPVKKVKGRTTISAPATSTITSNANTSTITSSNSTPAPETPTPPTSLVSSLPVASPVEPGATSTASPASVAAPPTPTSAQAVPNVANSQPIIGVTPPSQPIKVSLCVCVFIIHVYSVCVWLKNPLHVIGFL